jgi:hypothetical protein
LQESPKVSREPTVSIFRFENHVKKVTSMKQAAQTSQAPGGEESDICPHPHPPTLKVFKTEKENRKHNKCR